MNTTLTMPGPMVAHLRTGLYSEIDAAVEELAIVLETRDREQQPERLSGQLERLDAARALLNLIGWTAAGSPADPPIDLCEHRGVLLAALRAQRLNADDALEDADAVDAERVAKGQPPRRPATLRRVSALRDFVAKIEAQVSAVSPTREETR